MIDLQRDSGIAILTLRHARPLNPFSLEMTRQLVELGPVLEGDDAVKGVLIWGGEERSFSAGGDFAAIRTLSGRAQYEEYLLDIVRSYQALLAISKPLVAAVDHYAIGQGLQVALMADWRIGTERAVCQMPELANGVPCPLGSTILETLLGRAAMLQLVVGCAKLDAREALALRLLDELCPAATLKAAGLARLERLCSYPQLPYRLTKQLHNARFARALDEVAPEAARIHATTYVQGAADAHFDRVLGRRP